MGQIADDIVLAPAANLNRPVVDRTGLTGDFDFVMNFAGLDPRSPDASQPSDPDALTFLEALKDQLGLKLQPATGSVQSPIVDHIEEPSPN